MSDSIWQTEQKFHASAVRLAISALAVALVAACSSLTVGEVSSQLQTELANPSSLAQELETQADAAEKKGSWREAAALWARALKERQRGLRDNDRLRAADRAMKAHLKVGALEVARGYGEFAAAEAVALFGEIHVEVGLAYNTLGTIHRRAGDFHGAVRYYEKALEIIRQVLPENSQENAATLGNLGVAYFSLGNLDRAIALNQESLSIYELLFGPDHPEVAVSLGELSVFYIFKEDLGTALELSSRSLSVREKAFGPDHIDLILPIGNLAVVYSRLGDHDRAIQLFERALLIEKAAKGPDHPDMAMGYMSIGVSQLAKNALEEALANFDRAVNLAQAGLKANQPNYAQILTNRATALRRLGRTEAALRDLEHASRILETALPAGHWRQGFTLGQRAALRLELAQTAEAGRDANSALQIALRTGNGSLEWRALDLQRKIALQDGNAELAAHWGKQAANTIQSQRSRLTEVDRALQQSFLAEKRSVYTDLADLLVQLGRLLEAEQVMAMLKDEEFFDFIRREATEGAKVLRSPSVGLAESGAAAKLTVIRRQFADLERELTAMRPLARLGLSEQQSLRRLALESQREELERELAVYLDALPDQFKTAGSHRDGAALTARRVALRTGEATIQFIVARDRLSMILATTEIKIARTQSVSAKGLAQQVNTFRELLQARGDTRALALELYGLLVKPIAEELAAQRVKRIHLSLDGVLRYLPFAALHDGKNFLVERFAISVVSSVGDGTSRATRAGQWAAAGLGLTLALPGFPALPAVREELRAIQREVIKSETFLDSDFTRDRLLKTLAQGTPIVHVASHFRFQSGTEVHSYLLLGDGQRMTLRDLRSQSLKLHGVELLTLSACETALGGGSDETGAEIEGLGVLLQKLGANAVLATLWPIADNATPPMMRQLYRARIRSQLGNDESLRTAQLYLLRGNAGAAFLHPFFWAGYVLLGGDPS